MDTGKKLYICKCGNICENGICLGCLKRENEDVFEKLWEDIDKAYKKLSKVDRHPIGGII